MSGSSPDPRVIAIAGALLERRQTLATVECTLGGGLGALLTTLAGASGWYQGSVAPYSYATQRTLLGTGGAVSAETAAALALAGRERLAVDWCLAETGIAGPRGSHRSAKAPGTCHIALVGPAGVSVTRLIETGRDDRAANRHAFLEAALTLLADSLSAI